MKTIPLTRGMVAVVYDCDYEFLSQWKWYALGRPKYFYAVRSQKVGGKRIAVLMHRVIAGAVEGQDVDHKDHCTLNNQRENLRTCNRSQNVANSGLKSNNKTGFKGVYKAPSGKWKAQIRQQGTAKHLGTFDSAESASRAYNSAAVNAFGEFAKANPMLQ